MQSSNVSPTSTISMLSPPNIVVCLTFCFGVISDSFFELDQGHIDISSLDVRLGIVIIQFDCLAQVSNGFRVLGDARVDNGPVEEDGAVVLSVEVVQGQTLAELGKGFREGIGLEELACLVLHLLCLHQVLPCLLKLRIVRVFIKCFSDMLPPQVCAPIVREQEPPPIEEVGVVDELVLDEGAELDGLGKSVQVDEYLDLLGHEIDGVGAVSEQVVQVVQGLLVLTVVHCLCHVLLILYQLFTEGLFKCRVLVTSSICLTYSAAVASPRLYACSMLSLAF